MLKNFRDLIKWFVCTDNPWFRRGEGVIGGTDTGVFFLDRAHSSFYDSGSFRKFTKIKSYTSYYVSKVFFNLRY